jgi:hypothetical protein
MEKRLTMLIAALVVFGVILAGGGASADDMIIGREVKITGVGVINADIELKTEPGYTGIALTERVSTPGGGFEDLSMIKYFSSYELGYYNDNDTVNSSSNMEYESVAKIINAKRSVYTRNYMLGAVMGVKSKGDTDHEIFLYSDDYSSTAELEGNSIGKLKLFEKVISLEDKHSVLSYDVIELDGKFNVSWNAYAELYTYPEDEIISNWLGCP